MHAIMWSNSGSVLVTANGLFTELLTEKLSYSDPYYIIPTSYHRILVRRVNTMVFLIFGRWPFKYPMKRNDNDSKSLELTYSKDRTWLKYFGHSNFLCVRATKAIINHAPIREY